VRLERAFAIVRHVVDGAHAPVSVYVVDGGGEVVAAASMDGALPESRQAAREKALAGRVEAFDHALRVGSVGVSGLADGADDALAAAAIAAAGLRLRGD
jgi:uncharacterized protein GlcG (DUF336 family)